MFALLLAHNELWSLPVELTTLPKLQWLQADGNGLTSLPTWPKDSLLRHLFANENKLRTVLGENLPSHLESLSLQTNLLTQIPANLPDTVLTLEMRGNNVPVDQRDDVVIHQSGKQTAVHWN